MGLSASSLRIAMLTARKSSLEFEGQQINQQRLTLSNQSAALFNSMLTMQVPTPPDPSEFSKMVYTFNKGNGLSEIINVSKNISGGYTHDVTYKSPKTDSVLMKKQLNNVGFKSVNGQMSAVIDGINYDLTLNGDKEKLDEYIKTKETYDNIKNIETQMASLQKMSSTKELTSQQMKQYFETLGLSSVETPQMGNVLDVQTIDDAFRNVYNEGNGYSYQNVTLTYTSSTSPITLDPSKRNLLKVADNTGTLTMGADNKHYTYITKCAPASTQPTLSNPITYNITQDDSGNWSWTLNNATERILEAYEIGYEQISLYGHNDQSGNFVEGFKGYSYNNNGTTYSNICYENGYWSWSETSYVPSDEFEYLSAQGTLIKLQENNPIEIDSTVYTPTCENGQWYFTTNPQVITLTPPSITTIYDVNSDGKNETFEWNSEANSYTCTTVPNFDYSITSDDNNNYVLTASSNNYFGINQEYSKDNQYFFHIEEPTISNVLRCLEIPKDMQGYWYNTKGYVAYENGGLVTNSDNENYRGKDDWVYVTKKENDPGWQYQKQLTQVAGSAIFEGNTYTSNDNGLTYQYYDEEYGNHTGEANKGRMCILSQDKNDKWQMQYRYTEAQLGITKQNKMVRRTETKQTNSPPGLTFSVINKDKYTWEANGKEYTTMVYSMQMAQVDEYQIQKNNTGFILSGQGLPSGVAEKSASEGDSTQYQGTSNDVEYTVQDNGEANPGVRYSISAKFNAWVKGDSLNDWSNDEEQDGYSYNTTNHTLTLTTPTGVIAQMLLRNNNNERNEDCDRNITVNEMLGFYEEILKQFGLYGSSQAYKIKLDTARSNYLSTIDAQGVENPEENQALFNFIDTNGKNAYIYVPLDYINKDGQVDSTYAYMYETSYLENQTETISQKANIIYDENGRIAKITFDDGTVVIPEVKTEQDEEAYNSAMVKYDYEKQQYDKEISDINAKTEVIAQQDKNLEIKLKSIDTQHTAIQTEIESLNKVLENNVKSSFGTFSA